MSGRGREATLPAWMAPNAQPPGAPPQAAGPRPAAPAPFPPGAGGGPPPGWPAPGAPPTQGQPPPGQPAPGMGGPPPGIFPGPPGAGQPPFAGPPPFGPGGLPPPGGMHFPPPGGLPQPGPGAPPGALPPGAHPAPGPGMPPGPFPGPPPGMQPPMLPPPGMWLPPGARPPPMHGVPMPFPGMPPPGAGAPPHGAPGMPFPGMPPLMQPPQQPPGHGGPPGPGSAQPGQPGQLGQPGQPGQPGQSGQPGQPATGGAAGPSKSAWTEHTAPDGRKYYYNGQTKQSSWEKPAELLSAQEKAEQVPWKEYTAPDGRKYYYNRETKESKWTMPEELRRHLAKTGGAGAAAGGTPPATSTPPTDAGKAEASDSGKGTTPEATSRGTPEPAASADKDAAKYQYATKAEAKDAFKQLLSSVGCTSDWSWEQALKHIVNDPRYAALKSLGEKKACFNEYIQQRRNQEKEDERRRLKVAREEFIQMIVHSPELKMSHGYRRAKEILEENPAWKAVPDREREELFSEAMKEKDKKDKEERRLEKQRRGAAFRALLEDMGIKLGTEWRKACTKLEGQVAFDEMDKVDRLEVYQEYQKELERRDREEKEREREARRREDRRARDDFRALLTQHRAQGLINVKMRWWEYSRHVVGEEAYRAMERTLAGSRPKELFEYLIEDLEKEYDVAKSVMKHLIRQAEIQVTANSSFEDFQSQMQQAEASTRPSDSRDEGQLPDAKGDDLAKESKLDKIDAELKVLYFEELVGRAKQRDVEEAERKRRAQEKFGALLRHLRKLDVDTTWEQFLDDYGREPELKTLGADDAKPIFDEYIAKLKQRKSEKRRKGSDDDGSDASRERARKRSQRDDDSDDEGHRKHKKKSSRRRDDDSDDEDRKSRKRKHKDKSRNKDRDRDESSQGRGDGEADDGAAGNGEAASGPATSGGKAD